MEKGFLGTDVVVQVGILVNDIDKSAQDFADFLGMDKPAWMWSGTYEQAQTEYLGKPSQARAKLAFFSVGPTLNIELIEPDDEPSTWRDDLNAKGEGIHHLAFYVKGMGKMVAACERNGMPLLQKGEYTGGRYAYLDAKGALKTIIELLEND